MKGRVRIASRKKQQSDISAREDVNAGVMGRGSGAGHEHAEMSEDAASGPPGPALGPGEPSHGLTQSEDATLETHEDRKRYREPEDSQNGWRIERMMEIMET